VIAGKQSGGYGTGRTDDIHPNTRNSQGSFVPIQGNFVGIHPQDNGQKKHAHGKTRQKNNTKQTKKSEDMAHICFFWVLVTPPQGMSSSGGDIHPFKSGSF
jgi:hypothetical protein